MQRKALTTINGTVIQITVSPFEMLVLRRMAAKASIPNIADSLVSSHDSVGRVIRDFYTLLETKK